MTIFKRRFRVYPPMAKARCEWDVLKFDPSTQKLHEVLDILQKTAFGTEAQQFIDKATYAKMLDHVKKLLNRAYLEVNPYNDIVLNLERVMRLKGFGAPYRVTLVPLNKLEPAQTKTETKPAENGTQNTKKIYCFYCNKVGHFKAECTKTKKDKWQQTRKNNGQPNNNAGSTLKCDTCANHTKQKIFGMDPTLPTIHDRSVTANRNERLISPSNLRSTKTTYESKKLNTPRLRFVKTVDARAFSIEDPHHTQRRNDNRM